jgi:hypothetical protein
MSGWLLTCFEFYKKPDIQPFMEFCIILKILFIFDRLLAVIKDKSTGLTKVVQVNYTFGRFLHPVMRAKAIITFNSCQWIRIT